MNFNALPIPEIERVVIVNLARIREIGKGRVTTRSIAAFLGVDDKASKSVILSAMKRSPCFKWTGQSFIPLVDSFIEPDFDVINADPTMALMNNCYNDVIASCKDRAIAWKKEKEIARDKS
jgi:hypothetical protein